MTEGRLGVGSAPEPELEPELESELESATEPELESELKSELESELESEPESEPGLQQPPRGSPPWGSGAAWAAAA